MDCVVPDGMLDLKKELRASASAARAAAFKIHGPDASRRLAAHGLDFLKVINQKVGACDVMLAVIGWWQFLGVYYYVGIAVATGLVYYQYRLIRSRDRGGCFKAFRNNNWVGAAIFVGLAVDLQTRLRIW